jgi:hypothetical protein
MLKAFDLASTTSQGLVILTLSHWGSLAVTTEPSLAYVAGMITSTKAILQAMLQGTSLSTGKRPPMRPTETPTNLLIHLSCRHARLLLA